MTLPIPDFDHMPLPALTHRVRSLDLDDIDTLIAHEQGQANRLPVLEVLRTRRASSSSRGRSRRLVTSPTSTPRRATRRTAAPSIARRRRRPSRRTATGCAR